MATIILGHRSIDPHCIFSGYTFCQYNYGSAVYFMEAIPKKSLSLKHRYAYLGFETCHNICLMVVCIFFHPLCIHTLARKILQSTSVIMSSNFVLWGEICYTSKLLTSIVSQVSSLQVLLVLHIVHKCHILTTSVASVTNIILPSFLFHASNDIIKTLKTPQRLVLKKRN
jgi:hypothetical protein